MRELIVRAPNYLGDLVMALPALRAAGPAAGVEGPVDVQVNRWLVPLLEMARAADDEAGRPPWIGEVLPLDRGARGIAGAAFALRRRGYRRGVLLPGSFSSALIFALGGVRHRRGLSSDARAALLHDAVPAERIAGLHRVAESLVLVGAEPEDAEALPAPRLPVPALLLRQSPLARASGSGDWIGVVPSASAPSRRWDADRFAELVRRLYARGLRVAVFGGPEDATRTRIAAGEHGLDLGAQTTLPELAAALASCRLVVSNDSGPLHLAAAVGVPTVSLWGAGDLARTGLVGGAHRVLRRPELPCVPCVRNRCPRRDEPGYELDRGERECLRLIGVGDVEAAVQRALEHSAN